MVERRTVLVTGANGFIGSALVARLVTERMWKIVASVRVREQPFAEDVRVVPAGEVRADTDWSHALQGVHAVVHAAAVAHVPHVSSGEQLTRLRMTNVDGVLALAYQAAAAGVKRFVFISSIGVNGNINVRPFTALDVPVVVY